MERALELALRGAGAVNPNPLVGAVLVKNGEIVGQGWHQRFGGPHAEVNALEAAGPQTQGATLYVTLEPCCHFGKTPPCTEALIAAGVKRCYVAMKDPNPLVAGKGLQRLRSAGIEVHCGLLEEEARHLNQPFLKRVAGELPYVFVKAAVTLDGKLATRSGNSKWISNEAARLRVHQLRSRFASIAVGAETLRADNPLLTARLPEQRSHQPARIVIDGKLNLSLDTHFVKQASDGKSYLVTTTQAAAVKEVLLKQLQDGGVRVATLPQDPTAAEGRFSVNEFLKTLQRWNIDSVLVEGGGSIFSWLKAADVIDAGEFFVAPKILGDHEALSLLQGFSPETVEEGWILPHSQCYTYDGQFSYRFYKRMW